MTKRHQHAHDILMAYRYLYYVMAWGKIPDSEYDRLERKFKEMYPECQLAVEAGSDRVEGYTPYQIIIAKVFMLEEMLRRGALFTDDKVWADIFT